MQFVRMSNICSIFLSFRHQYTCLYMYFCFFGGPFVATMNKPLGEVFSPVLYILYWNRGFAWGDKLKSILYCQYESPLITNLELVRPQKKSRLNSYRQCNGIALLHTNEFGKSGSGSELGWPKRRQWCLEQKWALGSGWGPSWMEVAVTKDPSIFDWQIKTLDRSEGDRNLPVWPGEETNLQLCTARMSN